MKSKRNPAKVQADFHRAMRDYFAQPEVQAQMKRLMNETLQILDMKPPDLEELQQLSKQEFLETVIPLIKNGMRRQVAEKSNFSIN